MTAAPHQDNRAVAIACIIAGVGLATSQDAVMKGVSGDYPAYEALMARCVGALPVLFYFLRREKLFGSLMTPLLPRILLRGLILGIAYVSYIMAIAKMPMADGVAIYFTMPFFVAGLAGPLLGERVRMHRWFAIVAGFLGVLIMVRPGATMFEPAALLAFVSAAGYAVGQMIGRPIAQEVRPTVIAAWQNLIYFAMGFALALVFNLVVTVHFSHPSLAFVSRSWVWPSPGALLLLTAYGAISAGAMLLFVNAYKYGETNFVAPFEYSAMIWAILFGLTVFHDVPDRYTLIGATVVVVAGLLMVWRDRVLDRATVAATQ